MDVRTLNVGDKVVVFKPTFRGHVKIYGTCTVTKKNKVRIVLSRETDLHEFVFSAKHGNHITKYGPHDYETFVMSVESAAAHEEENKKTADRWMLFRDLEIAAKRSNFDECKNIVAKLEALV